jgi:hypothetical protein
VKGPRCYLVRHRWLPLTGSPKEEFFVFSTFEAAEAWGKERRLIWGGRVTVIEAEIADEQGLPVSSVGIVSGT